MPRAPPPLSDVGVEGALRHPIGQKPISVVARGRRRPFIVVDDLTCPTPAERVLPGPG
jgi:hypothetical protein